MNQMPTELIEILYQDPYLVAAHKPPGMLVHRSHLATEADAYLLQLVRDKIGQRVNPLHRLDRPTSGIVLFALETDMTRQMRRMFTDQEIEKTYTAIVRGYVSGSGTIDHPLKKPRDYRSRPDKEVEAKSAVTHYDGEGQIELPHAVGPYQTARYSLITLWPKSGRTHQLRRHMAHISHPIIGDTRYGDSAHNVFFRERFDCHRLLLAATKVQFVHPITGQKIEISCPPIGQMAQILALFR